VLYFPQVPVNKDGKNLLVGLLQIHYLVPLASDWASHRMFLELGGHGVAFHYPEVPSLHTRGVEDVQALASSIHGALDRRGRSFVSIEELHMNLRANFNHLKTEQLANPDILMVTKNFTFVSTTGEPVCCSLEYFNTENNNNELETHVSTHSTTILSRPDGSKVQQQLYMLTWNLCVDKTTRVVLETEVGEVDRLFEAISLNAAGNSMAE
jgi:hypothetical protein